MCLYESFAEVFQLTGGTEYSEEILMVWLWFRRVGLVLLAALFGFAFFGKADIALSRNSDAKTILVHDSGLTCQVELTPPWQNFSPIFGFTSVVYQESARDIHQRAMLAFVVTPVPGREFKNENIESEFASFRKAKADYVAGEGGEFIGRAESLVGDNGIHRVSVRYRLEGDELQDSSYFFFRNGRLVHAKALFNFKYFEAAALEKQILALLSGVRCKED